MIGRILRGLANIQCIQTTHYAQDAKHQYEAIKEAYNEYVKDHRFKPTCTHFQLYEFKGDLNSCSKRRRRGLRAPPQSISKKRVQSIWSAVDANRTILMTIV
jgi:hypothetical protein